MQVILGLGNPGAEYINTRHNAGVLLVNKLAENIQSDYGWRRKKDIFIYESSEVTVVKSAGVFMNESGRMAKSVVGGKLSVVSDLFVVHDDLDIKLGEYKIQFGVGPKVHGGLLSIERELKTKDFWRVRIGIDNRQIPRNKIQDTKNSGGWEEGEKYVLQRFSLEERKVLNEVLEKILNEISLK